MSVVAPLENDIHCTTKLNIVKHSTVAHMYTMTAHFEMNILIVEVYDSIQGNRFRNEFVQRDFTMYPIFDVAKILVDAINSTQSNKNTISINGFKPISISEYGKWCYLTVNFQATTYQSPQYVHNIYVMIGIFLLNRVVYCIWKFKIKNESKKFSAMPYRSNMDRIIGIMTFYHDNHNEEFNIFSYVNDSESDYKYLKDDYDNIISNNIISNNNIITMKKQFGIFVDYISQMFPICSHNKCNIFRRYSDDKHNNEDDDMFDDKVQHFKQIMDILHCYLFHTEHCGIIIINDKMNLNKNNNSNNLNYINLKFGGLWYWFYDDSNCKWIPYNKCDQLKLNMGWRNNNKEVMVGVNNKYKVQFKRDSNNIDPFGHQYDCKRNDSWRRAVIYGVTDINGMLNGIMCDKNPM